MKILLNYNYLRESNTFIAYLNDFNIQILLSEKLTKINLFNLKGRYIIFIKNKTSNYFFGILSIKEYELPNYDFPKLL